jgi:hypothetical protein
MRLRPFLLSSLLSLLGLVFPSEIRGQDIGNVGLRTVSATVASGATCTGSAQTFTTAQGITNFRNIGQTSHLATATSNATTFQMEIDGIDNLGNVFRLSDLQVGIPTSAKGGLVVTASGYMTTIQINITCSSGSTFSVSYTGSFSPSPPNIAGSLLVAVDKLPFQTAPANASASTTFQSPTGNSQGTIIFQYAAAGPSGSTVTATCLSNAGTTLQAYTFSISTATTPQLFQVPASTCPFITLAYTSGGASATTYNLEYTFTTSGTTSVNADPCLSSSVAKLSAPIPNQTAVGTTQIIAGVAGQRIYPCAIIEDQASGSTNWFAQWEYGTGASCGTGTTALSGTMGVINGQISPRTSYGPTLFNIPAGNSLCDVLSGTMGSNANYGGWIVYVQQ